MDATRQLWHAGRTKRHWEVVVLHVLGSCDCNWQNQFLGWDINQSSPSYMWTGRCLRQTSKNGLTTYANVSWTTFICSVQRCFIRMAGHYASTIKAIKKQFRKPCLVFRTKDRGHSLSSLTTFQRCVGGSMKTITLRPVTFSIGWLNFDILAIQCL